MTARRNPRLTGPRVALVGDAAHAVSASFGQGVNAALEDVAALDKVRLPCRYAQILLLPFVFFAAPAAAALEDVAALDKVRLPCRYAQVLLLLPFVIFGASRCEQRGSGGSGGVQQGATLSIAFLIFVHPFFFGGCVMCLLRTWLCLTRCGRSPITFAFRSQRQKMN